jgi:hypothetical protein
MNASDASLKISEMLENFQARDERKLIVFKRQATRVTLNNLGAPFGFAACQFACLGIILDADITTTARKQFSRERSGAGPDFEHVLSGRQTVQNKIVPRPVQDDLQWIFAVLNVNALKCHSARLEPILSIGKACVREGDA